MNTTKNITWITFSNDKNGKRLAHRMDRRQHRSFRIGLDAALMMIAAGTAREEVAR